MILVFSGFRVFVVVLLGFGCLCFLDCLRGLVYYRILVFCIWVWFWYFLGLLILGDFCSFGFDVYLGSWLLFVVVIGFWRFVLFVCWGLIIVLWFFFIEVSIYCGLCCLVFCVLCGVICLVGLVLMYLATWFVEFVYLFIGCCLFWFCCWLWFWITFGVFWCLLFVCCGLFACCLFWLLLFEFCFSFAVCWLLVWFDFVLFADCLF